MLSVDEVVARVAAYVRASDAERAQMTMHDDVLACLHNETNNNDNDNGKHTVHSGGTDVLIAALEEARVRMAEAQRDAHEACRAVDDVAHALSSLAEAESCSGSSSSSGGGNVLAPVLPSERAAFADEHAVHDVFARTLQQLLRAAAQPAITTAERACPATTTTHTPWHRDGALVLHVLSFLSTREVLTAAEDVCTAWRYWLAEPSVSRPFWLACVHREFASQLQALLRSEDADTLCAYDWRAVAMLCVCEEDDNEEGGGAGEDAQL